MSRLEISLPEQLQNLKLHSYQPLLDLRKKGREICHQCKSSRKYYCYQCNALVGVASDEIPNVVLPVHVDIIKHPGEKASKSTSSHAVILAPQSTSIYHYPDMPQIKDKSKAILIYPSKNSRSMEELSKEIYDGQLKSIIFIDSTWNQANSIYKHEALADIRKVQLSDVITSYWRPQYKKPTSYLATIEAVYYFCVEYHKHVLKREYYGEYDDLLYIFIFQYNLIKQKLNT